MKSMPSVWMKAGMRKRTTTVPLTRPTSAPVSRPPRIATGTGSAAAVISLAETTAERPATEPTERSNSPATSSMVWPMAMMPTKETTRRMARTLRSEMKAGSIAVKSADEQDQRGDHADLADGDEPSRRPRRLTAPVVAGRGCRDAHRCLPVRGGRCGARGSGRRSRRSARPPIRSHYYTIIRRSTAARRVAPPDDTGTIPSPEVVEAGGAAAPEERPAAPGGRMAAGSDEGGGGKPIGRLGVRDIARQVGLAPMTVSRALSNPELVAPATRAKVLAAIEKAGFVPNRLASSMRGAGRMIGTVVPPLINSGIAEQVQGMSDECHEQRLLDAAGAGRVHRRGRGGGDPHLARLAPGRDDPAELRAVGGGAGAARSRAGWRWSRSPRSRAGRRSTWRSASRTSRPPTR